jgi:hypothetical protein
MALHVPFISFLGGGDFLEGLIRQALCRGQIRMLSLRNILGWLFGDSDASDKQQGGDDGNKYPFFDHASILGAPSRPVKLLIRVGCLYQMARAAVKIGDQVREHDWELGTHQSAETESG